VDFTELAKQSTLMLIFVSAWTIGQEKNVQNLTHVIQVHVKMTEFVFKPEIYLNVIASMGITGRFVKPMHVNHLLVVMEFVVSLQQVMLVIVCLQIYSAKIVKLQSLAMR
jgi:hypothetical protein